MRVRELKIMQQATTELSFLRDAKNMAAGVRNVLLNIVRTKGNMSDNEAEQYIEKMERDKRYLNDEWLFRNVKET